MARTYNIISADGHVETPPDSWTKYVPEQHKDRAPRLIKLVEGGEGWVIEGRPILHNGLNITGAKTLAPDADESRVLFAHDTYYNPDGSAAPGAGDAVQRLREQDQDGVDAEILYPPVFATSFIEAVADKRAYVSMVQAYNSFLAYDYCSVAPDRLIGNAVIPVSGIDDAVAELKRCHELGFRSVSPHQFPNGSGSPKPEDDRFWDAALQLGMRLSPHATLGDRAPVGRDLASRDTAAFAAGALGAGRGGGGPTHTMAQLIAYGVLDRFPDLRMYIAETNASWLPNCLWFMDDSYRTWKYWFNKTLPMLPSEYVKKHFMFSFIRDPMAMRLRDFLPVDNLMWGSDFPHSVGSFPHSQGWLDVIFEGVEDSLRRKILLENPAEFFGLDLTATITETPGVVAPV